MADDKTNGAHSDIEHGEKPVREKLEKASIDAESALSKSARAAENDTSEDSKTGTDVTSDAQSSVPDGSNSSGRLEKKRSHEDMEGESADGEAVVQHTRKRSRDGTSEEDQINNWQRKTSGEKSRSASDSSKAGQQTDIGKVTGQKRPGTPEPKAEIDADAAAEAVASPKSKRTRHHSSSADNEGASAESADAASAVGADKGEAAAKSATTTKENGGDAQGSSVLPQKSRFANTSTSSPFGAVAGAKTSSTEPAQTSSSAFNQSGFGALAGSTTSGFGAIGKSTGGFGSGGSFASAPKDTANGATASTAAASSSTFGGSLGQKSAFSAAPSSGSAFGQGASAFGKLGQTTSGFGSGFGGSGFGGLAGSSGGLTSFASGKAGAKLGTAAKPAKPFGAPANEDDDDDDDGNDDEDNEDGDGSGIKSPLASEVEKQDERFYEQELETGEEDETTQFTCRAKLYNFSTLPDGKKEWRERGFGTLRLNVKNTAPGETGPPQARLLMRAEGSHRVVLNTGIKKDYKFGDGKGDKPVGGLMLFMGAVTDPDGGAGKLELLQLKVNLSYPTLLPPCPQH